MEEIKIGDVFLANIGGVVPGFNGTMRPVRVIGKQKYYYECETVPYPNCFGEMTESYRIDYFEMELKLKIKTEKDLIRWISENPMGQVMFCDREDGKHPKQIWTEKIREFFGEERFYDS